MRGAPPLTGQPTASTDEELDVELAYYQDPKASDLVDASGPVPPRHQEELTLSVEDREPEPDDELAGDSTFTVQLGGSRRALGSLGLYLLALSRFSPRLPGYFDTLEPAGGKLIVHLSV